MTYTGACANAHFGQGCVWESEKKLSCAAFSKIQHRFSLFICYIYSYRFIFHSFCFTSFCVLRAVVLITF